INPAQGVFDGAELADFDFMLPGEDHRLATVYCLGVVARVVGALVEAIRRGAGIGCQCKSHRAADLGQNPGDGERRIEDGADPSADRKNTLGIKVRIDDDSKLVASETCDEMGIIGELQKAVT